MNRLTGKLLIVFCALILSAGISRAENFPFIFSNGARYIPQVPGLPSGVNNSGQVVGSFTSSTGFDGGYLYSNGTVSTVDVPNAVETEARGINGNGQIVGAVRVLATICGGTNCGAYLYSGGVYSVFSAPGADDTAAYGINDNGQIVGYYVSGNSEHGFLYAGGNFTALDVPGALGTSARSINNSGEIIGWYDTPSCGNYSFLYTQGSFTQLGPCQTYATGISASGEITGYDISGGRLQGFTYNSGNFSLFNIPGAVTTDVQGVSSDGNVFVGQFSTAEPGTRISLIFGLGVLIAGALRPLKPVRG